MAPLICLITILKIEGVGDDYVWFDYYAFCYLQELKKIVNQRMVLFNKTSIDDQSISEKLSPVLKKIQNENEELKKRAADLQTQLDSFEKQYSKVCFICTR